MISLTETKGDRQKVEKKGFTSIPQRFRETEGKEKNPPEMKIVTTDNLVEKKNLQRAVTQKGREGTDPIKSTSVRPREKGGERKGKEKRN